MGFNSQSVLKVHDAAVIITAGTQKWNDGLLQSLTEDLMLEHDNYESKLGLMMLQRLTVTASGYVASLVNNEDRPIH